MVPYGRVWRTGANEATTIRFSDPVRVAGRQVPAGAYALFTIPGPETWTVILNKRWRQFGAYDYQPKDDVVRLEVKPKVMKEHTEWLTYEIYPASRGSAYIDLYWEKLRVDFLVDVDVDAIVSARMRRAMAAAGGRDWKIYAEAAEYFYNQERELAQALGWAERSVNIQENPRNLTIKARLLRELGRGSEAFQALERALNLARAQRAPASVIQPIQDLLAQWRSAGNGATRR
jgi:tetratricopeptide (TPR) repeat protein